MLLRRRSVGQIRLQRPVLLELETDKKGECMVGMVRGWAGGGKEVVGWAFLG